MLQRQAIGHFETEAGTVEHKPLVSVGADRLNTVVHGHQHIAGATEGLTAVVTKCTNHPVVNVRREAPPGAKLSDFQTQTAVEFDLLLGALFNHRISVRGDRHTTQPIPQLAD